jgi:hypothetical protein
MRLGSSRPEEKGAVGSINLGIMSGIVSGASSGDLTTSLRWHPEHFGNDATEMSTDGIEGFSSPQESAS